MTFAQFLVSSLLGLTVYALGFNRGLKQGHDLAQREKPKPVTPE